MKSKTGVGSILRKEERKESSYLNGLIPDASGKPTHRMRKIKIYGDKVIGYLECVDKSTVKVPIQKCTGGLFFGTGNEEYVKNGLQDDLIRAEEHSKEFHKEFDTLAQAGYEMAPRTIDGKLVSIDLVSKEDDKNE